MVMVVASHWKDNLGLGIMDPTLAPGELAKVPDIKLSMSSADRIPTRILRTEFCIVIGSGAGLTIANPNRAHWAAGLGLLE
jgi:hypothetical protein